MPFVRTKTLVGGPREHALVERPVLQIVDPGGLDAVVDRARLAGDGRDHDRNLGLHHVRGTVGRAGRCLLRLAHVQRDLVSREPAEIVVGVAHRGLRGLDLGRVVDGVRLAVGHEPERDERPGCLLRRPERRFRRAHAGTCGGRGRHCRADEQHTTRDPDEQLASHRQLPLVDRTVLRKQHATSSHEREERGETVSRLDSHVKSPATEKQRSDDRSVGAVDDEHARIAG